MQIVSLTTDYGTKDYYAGELKASILSVRPDTTLIDISNDVDPFDIVQAAFFLRNALPSFPKGSIHILSVHSNYKRKSEYIAFTRDGHFFIGPNNGVFSILFEDIDPSSVYLLNHAEKFLMPLHRIYADACAYLSHGLPIDEIGPAVISFQQKSIIQPVVTSSIIRATIIHIDRFENVVVNLKQDLFEKVRNGRSFALYYKQYDPITFLCRDYGDVALGDPMAFFNAAGYLEIAMNMDKASSLLNLYKNEIVQINFF
jgi:S-adenosyl-L-methionine hydrolase (adenosine-forming)